MTGKKTSPDGYIRVGKFYISVAYIMGVFLGLLGLIIIYSAAVHPLVVKKWYELQTLPTFRIDSPYLEQHTGAVRLILPDGSLLYEGEVEAASAQGTGRLYDGDLLIYYGEFSDNLYNGDGTLYYPDGSVMYSGVFEQNMYSGTGELYDEMGNLVYSGGFLNGTYDGRGKEYLDGILCYDGDFVNGVYSGAGRLYEKGRLLYEGEFFGGVFNGTGKLYSEDVSLLYDGKFLDGVFSGTGKLYSEDESLLYDGEFLIGKYDGNGSLYKSGVLIYEGGFSKGSYNGSGIEYDALTGYPLFDGKYLNGKRMAAGTEFGKNGTPIEEPHTPAPEPVSYFGESYADVIAALSKSQAVFKEQFVDGMLLVIDVDYGVVYCFSVLSDKTPGFLIHIYYYGLLSVEGIVVGTEISEDSVSKDGMILNAQDLVVLGYSNTFMGNSASSTEIRTTLFYGERYVITAYYSSPPTAADDSEESSEDELDSLDAAEGGTILFLRIEIPSLG